MDKKTQKVGAVAALIAILMFSFSFALSPLYRVVCKVTGLNGGVNVAEVAETTGPAARGAQPILVQFLTANNANLPWSLHPAQNSMQVYPDQTVKMNFFARNNSNHTMTVQAIPSFAPPAAAQYFHKIECFCFRLQTLKAGETKVMPVVFRIDNKLPVDIHTIALAYTLFDVTEKRTS
jgi:cytochrome c oxidase assembly protein subunit 11